MIDYDVKVNLLDLLQRKFSKRQRNNESAFAEKDKKGGLNIYVSMQGPATDPSMEYNRRDARKAFKDAGSDDGLFHKDDDGRSSDPDYGHEDDLEFIDWEEDDGP